MIKKIDIAGIQLDNYTVREAIMIVERMMSDNVFKAIEEVDMETIVLAQEDEVVHSALESLDHSIIAESGILKAAGQGSMQRKHEIEGGIFLFEFLRRIERNHKTVFLLGETEKEVQEVCDYIQDEFPKIEIVGMKAVEDCVGTDEAIVNDINAFSVDMIISVLPSPLQERFLHENRDKMSVNLWYGVGSGRFGKRKHGILESLKRSIRIHRLEKHINSFEEQGVD